MQLGFITILSSLGSLDFWFQTGESEMDNYFDQNMHTDEILKVVFKHAGSRKIIFSYVGQMSPSRLETNT